MEVIELMKEAFDAYKEKIWEIIVISIIIMMGAGISMIAIVATFIVAGIYPINSIKTLEATYSLSFVGAVIAVLILATLLLLWLYSALYAVIESAVRRERKSLSDYFGRGGEKFLSLLGVSIISIVIILVPFLIIASLGYLANLLIPGLIIGGIIAIYFSIRLLFAVPLIYLADKKALEAVRESLAGTKRFFGDSVKIFLVTLLLGILSAIVGMVPIIGGLIQLLFFVPYSTLILFQGCQELYKGKKKAIRRKAPKRRKK